jgi:uncharacterized protein YgiM (DUF1202 family)
MKGENNSMRRILKTVLVLILLLVFIIPELSSVASAAGSSTMYVKTDNGENLGLRDKPSFQSKVLTKLKYGQEVTWDWSYAGNDGWSRIQANGKTGYVKSRYLVSSKPAPYKPPKPAPAPAPAQPGLSGDLLILQAELNAELASLKSISPCYVSVRPTRASGTVDFRYGPSNFTYVIATYRSGKELIAEGQTNNWWHVRDPETDETGYILKTLATKLDKPISEKAGNGTQRLGTLSVNGEFDISCKLPEGYKLQVVEKFGEDIVASVLSDDMTKPQMYISIAYEELYGEVDRMNDMSEEDLAVLENSFAASGNKVEISYRETGLGTKLLVAREIGADADFVSIISVYKGYLVEFTMRPSPKAAVKVLTDEQVQSAIDFLTDVTFTPVEG